MMDFIILKVNGIDLSAASHDQVLQAFNSASEPIVVEVARRPSSHQSSKPIADMTDLSPAEFISPYATSVLQSPLHTFMSPKRSSLNNHGLSIGNGHKYNSTDSFPRDLYHCVGGSGDLLKVDGIIEEDEDGNDVDEEEDQVEIVKQEVVLRKKQAREIFGLTLSYSALSASDNSESEVYISAIETNSVANKEPNIRLGDQILQINRVDVHSKAQVVSLFQNCGLEVRLLLGRPNIIARGNGQYTRNGTFNGELSPLEEVEYASVYDEVENKDKRLIHLDKDSGIGRVTDEANKTEESSSCDSSQASLKKSMSYQLMDNFPVLSDPTHIAQLMQYLALEYQQLQKLLHNSSDSPSHRVQPLPPPTLYQSTSRIVPRMGTKLEPQQSKPSNGNVTASGSNTSAYSTGADSTRSSPLTMEFGAGFNTSLLSLKIDPLSYNGKLMDDALHGQPKLNFPLNADQRSASSSSNSNVTDLRMTSSTIMSPYVPSSPGKTPQPPFIDTECHYYDVYDPLTKSMSELSKQTSRSNSLTEPSNGSDDHEYINAQLIKCDRLDNKMEWVVKKRPDGTRYITRRPVRHKILKDRERKFIEERNYTTEEEELNGDLLVNRYLTRTDKRKYYDKVKDNKHRRKVQPSSPQIDPAQRNEVQRSNRSNVKDGPYRNALNRQCDIAAFFVGSTMF